MNLKDIKNYKGYLPLISEEQQVINWISNLIGIEFKNKLWINKFNDRFVVRYRYGNKNIIQIYLKNKQWFTIPLPLWFLFSQMNLKDLNNECWLWIKQQQNKLSIKQKKVKITQSNTLDI